MKTKITKQIRVPAHPNSRVQTELVSHRPKFKALIYFNGGAQAIHFGWAQRTQNHGGHIWMVFNLDGKPILDSCSFLRETAIERASYVACFGKEPAEAA